MLLFAGASRFTMGSVWSSVALMFTNLVVLFPSFPKASVHDTYQLYCPALRSPVIVFAVDFGGLTTVLSTVVFAIKLHNSTAESSLTLYWKFPCDVLIVASSAGDN